MEVLELGAMIVMGGDVVRIVMVAAGIQVRVIVGQSCRKHLAARLHEGEQQESCPKCEHPRRYTPQSSPRRQITV